MSGKIVVVGSSNTDMIIKTPRIPKPGETVLGGEFSTAAGGKGANQAVAAARAGGDVAFIARVGDDMFGEQALEGFRRDGIDTTFVFRDAEAPSGVALIFVDDLGENSIAVASGANARLLPPDVEAAETAVAESDILLMQLEIPLETVRAATDIAKAGSARIILNPAPAQTLDDDLLGKLSILTPNESEAEILTGIPVGNYKSAGKAAEALRQRGVETVLVTLGARGVYAVGEEYTGLISGFGVKAVDTTAAGDVFNGALAVALAESMPLEDAVTFAQAAAALSVTKLGAQPSAPTLEEIEEFLAMNG